MAQKKKTNKAPPSKTAELTLRYTTKQGFRYRTYEFNLDRLPLLKKVKGETAPVYERARKVEVEGRKKVLAAREIKEQGGYYDARARIWRLGGQGGGGQIRRETTITTRGRAVERGGGVRRAGASERQQAPPPAAKRFMRLYSTSVYIIPLDQVLELEDVVFSEYFQYGLSPSDVYGRAIGNLKAKIMPHLGTIIDPKTGLERYLDSDEVQIRNAQIETSTS